MTSITQVRTPRIVFSPTLRSALIDRFNRTCQYCRVPSESAITGPDGSAWHIDHVMPLALGGSNAEDNLTLACAPCNYLKGDAHPESDWQNRVKDESSKNTKQRSALSRISAEDFAEFTLGNEDSETRHALRCLDAIDNIGEGVEYVALESLGGYTALGGVGISLRDIYEGRVKAVRKKSKSFDWYVPVEEIRRMFVQRFGDIRQFRVMLEEAIP